VVERGNEVPLERDGRPGIKLDVHTYDPRLGVTKCVGLQGKGIGGERASERDRRWDGRAFLAAFDAEKMSNVNVNFGDPGLVGRGQDGYLGVSSRVRSRLGRKKKGTGDRMPGAGDYLLTWISKRLPRVARVYGVSPAGSSEVTVAGEITYL
jgi:hypothetical protein